MIRLLSSLSIPLLLVLPAGAQEGQGDPKSASGSKSVLRELEEADDESRPAALVAFIEDQMATNAVYAGQFSALVPMREPVLALVETWIVESPDAAESDGPFRVACINVLRDLVDAEKASKELMEALRGLAKDEFEDSQVRQNAVFALAQFGDRSLVDAQIEAAEKQTASADLQQQFNGWSRLATIHYNLRGYDSAVKAYKETIRILEHVKQTQALPTTYYNCACSLALAGNTGEALDYLEKALDSAEKSGQPLERRMLQTDMDIASLRGEERFQELLDAHYGSAKKQEKGQDGSK